MNRVIIVGRTNIGKSTLFNRLSTTVKSLTFEQEGVTRDYVKDVVSWRGTTFELVDSAGLSFRKSGDPLLEKTRLAALELFTSSQLILFMVDGVAGLLPEDHEISKAVLRSGKPAILVVNKIDTKVALEQLYEFDRLGYKVTIPVSAQHGTGVGELLDTIIEQLASIPDVSGLAIPVFNVALLGKPNVGKSSLMNALLHEQRSLVSEIPGTTREAISETVQFFKETIQLTDTPGVRRRKSIGQELESLMVKSALAAVRRADVVLLLVDASAGALSDQELKLAYYAFEDQLKGLIILFNKYDLVTPDIERQLQDSLSQHDRLLDKLETVSLSCKTEKNVGKVLPAVQRVWQAYNQKFSDSELTLVFKTALIDRPIYKSGRQLQLYKARQIKTAPLTIVLFVNEPTWFGKSQLAFFENVLRSSFGLKGVPIHFIARQAR